MVSALRLLLSEVIVGTKKLKVIAVMVVAASTVFSFVMVRIHSVIV